MYMIDDEPQGKKKAQIGALYYDAAIGEYLIIVKSFVDELGTELVDLLGSDPCSFEQYLVRCLNLYYTRLK